MNLDVKVPATLLLLSRILYLPETMDASEQIAATIEQMPDTLKRAAKMAAVETEGGKVTAQEKLEIIAEQQAKIEAERLAKIASTVQALPISHVLEYEDANGFKVTEVSDCRSLLLSTCPVTGFEMSRFTLRLISAGTKTDYDS